MILEADEIVDLLEKKFKLHIVELHYLGDEITIRGKRGKRE